MLQLDSDQRRRFWQTPAELRTALLPRDVRFTARGWVIFLVIGCGLAFFTAMATSAYSKYQEDLRVQRELPQTFPVWTFIPTLVKRRDAL